MSTQPVPAPTEKTLYIICHGAIALLQSSTNLMILIPDLGSAHTYRAGSWLGETTIEKGSMNILENVTGGQGNVVNAHIGATSPVPPSVPPFATFVLPRPKAVYTPFQIEIQPIAFDTTPPNLVPTNGLMVDYVTILEYSFTVTPSLGSIWPVAGDTTATLPDNPLTLHIYAEDEIPLDDSHSIDAFNLTCKILGLKYRLSTPTQIGPVRVGIPAKPILPVGKIPPGLEYRLFELQPLDERRAALLAMAGAKESGIPFSDPWASLSSESLQKLAVSFFGLIFSGDRFDQAGGSCLNVSGSVSAGPPPSA